MTSTKHKTYNEVMIQKVNHFAISVKDLNQVVAFFRDVFGLTKIEIGDVILEFV